MFGNGTALIAIEYRYRRSPISLARDTPVSQPIGRGRLTETVQLSMTGHFVLGRRAGLSVPKIRMDQHTFTHIRVLKSECLHCVVLVCEVGLRNYLTDGQSEFVREFEIAFVVGGDA